METENFEICKLCTKVMIDPRILPCSDSFCLKCLESLEMSSNSSKCPTCEIEFKIPQGGFKDLKRNEFIEQLSNIKQNLVPCDSCKKNQSINFCLDCSFNYCQTCLEHHNRIPVTSSHQLEAPASKDEIKVNLCKEHSVMKTLFCESCNILLCSLCSSLKHKRPYHKMKGISKYFDSVKEKLEQNLKAKEETIERIHSSMNVIHEKRCSDALKASNLKQEIQQRGEDLKSLVDTIVAESQKSVDEELQRQCKEAGDVLNELTNLEKNLKAEVEALQGRLKNMTCENVPEVFPQTTDKDENIPEHSGNFEVSFHFHVDKQLIGLTRIFGDVVKVQNARLVNDVNFEGGPKLFAPGRNGIYACVGDGSTFEIKKVFPCPEWSTNVSSYMINNLLTSVYDVLVYDDKFFVSGNIDTKKSTCTNGIVRISSGYSSVIYESQIKGTWGMSKLNDAKFLVILYSQILFMDVRTDRVIKEMDFPFRIQAALHVKDCLVVSSLGKVFIINEVGEQLFTFLRYKTFKTSISQSSTNLSLTKDKHGNIYVCLLDGKTFILDLNLRLKAVCDLRIERSMYSTKICFDEERGLLLAFNSPGRLLTYEL